MCGVGGRLDAAPADLAEAVRAVDRLHGERVARRLERYVAIPDGTEVWTLDRAGRYHRGVLTGPWSYDASAAAWAVDLCHVRPCRWSAPVDPQTAPPAVVASYERGGRNLQRVRAAG